MRVFRSKNPTGPFVDAAGRSAIMSANTNLDSVGLKVMGNYKFSTLDTAYMAGGHNSVLRDDDGRWYLFYHTRFNTGNEFHQVRVHSMFFNEDGWPVVAPFEYSGDKISQYGYEPADIVGEYEYINHGNDTSATIHNYSKIKLNADGTISGSASGTWSQSSSSSAATLKIGGQTYKGHFLAAQDETGKMVMSFTAVGSNNQTVWGAKTEVYTGTPRNQAATSFADGATFRLKNVNSGLYMQIADGKAENGTNVQQWGDNNKAVHEIWKLYNAGAGYYYIASAAGDSDTYVLDVAGKKTDNGTNIDVYQFNGGTNQQFMLTENNDGSYKLRTKVSGGSSAVEIVDGLTTSGANVQQWEQNGADCQKWILKDFGKDNYYWIRSYQDNGYALKAEGSEVGSNISVSEYSSKDSSQLFRFTKNLDGTYSIITHASNDACFVEVGSASTEFGANILQWEPTSHNCQKWNAVTEVTTIVTTTTTTTTTTTSKATTTTEKVTTQPVTTEPVKLTGDVNGDKQLSTADAVLLQKWLANAADIKDLSLADVNNDGKLNVFDLIILKRKLLNEMV